jgi:hypothetical protein
MDKAAWIQAFAAHLGTLRAQEKHEKSLPSIEKVAQRSA